MRRYLPNDIPDVLVIDDMANDVSTAKSIDVKDNCQEQIELAMPGSRPLVSIPAFA